MQSNLSPAIITVISLLLAVHADTVAASYRFSDWSAQSPIHILANTDPESSAISPASIKAAYHLPQSGGNGTIAIITAYDSSSAENDLAVFNKKYHLKECTSSNGCFEKKLVDKKTLQNSGWRIETALDME